MSKKIINVLIIAAFIFTTSTVYASEVEECKVSDAYLEWSKLSESERKNHREPAYCESNGLEDNEIPSSLNRFNNVLKAASLPDYYEAKLSSVKDQNVTPTCWAFASTTVLESLLKKQYDINVTFSPQHLNYMESQSFYDITKNTIGYDRDVNSGGGFKISSMYYINRLGPVLESTVPTDTTSDPLPKILSTTIKGVKNVIDVNHIEWTYRSKTGPCTETEKNKIKSLIYSNGPTGAGIYMKTSAYYNSTWYSYLSKANSTNVDTNHAVTIIGWNDNYPASRFDPIKPKNNGAWIVQNSYGTSFGNNGIFYVSYEDPQICTEIYSIKDVDGLTPDNKYISTAIASNAYANSTTTMNVFSKKSSVDELLTKVSFEVDQPETYKVYYYAGNAASKNIKVSKMKLIGSGTATARGWVTVKLKNQIKIPTSVKKYSIVVVRSKAKSPLVARTYKIKNSSGKIVSKTLPEKFSKGIYYYWNGKKWYDLYNFTGHYKNTINAFTDNIYLSVTGAKVNYAYDDSFTVNVTVKAKGTGTIDYVQLASGNTLIAENTDLNMSVTTGNTYTLSVKKSGLSDFTNGTYQLYVGQGNGVYHTYNVKINVIPISGIQITNKVDLELPINETLQMTTSLSPSNHNSTDPTIKWTTSSRTTATVDSNGVVTGKKAGYVTITATTTNGYKATYELRIIKPITDISLNRYSVKLHEGETFKSTATVYPFDTTDDKTVYWSSNDTSKATVDENGLITAVSSGIVNIKASVARGVYNNVTVSIVGLSLNKTNVSIELKNTYQLVATVINDDDNASTHVTWSSSNPSVATVDENGLVTAKKLGTTVITVEDDFGRVVTCNVTITKINAAHFTVSGVGNKTYNGKAQTQKIVVKYQGKTLKLKTDYTVKYVNNKNPGRASIVITANSKSKLYTGKKTIYFIIKPKKVTIKTPTSASKSITVKWNKHASVSGYQVGYRLKGGTWKYVNTTGLSKKITGLVKGKTYQVGVRAYKTVGTTKYYGAWSTIKTIKCK